MKEQNKKTLREALERLPDHQPPPRVWEGLAESLPPPLAGKLPSYQPAAGVWNSISREMERTDEAAARQRVAKQRQLPLRRIAGIAAAVLLLITAGLGINRYQNRQTVTIAYSQEVAPDRPPLDLEDAEGSFARARQTIADRNEPALNALGHELDELDEAKAEAKAMLAAYGEDPTIVRQLAEIERDRSDIYRRIIEL